MLFLVSWSFIPSAFIASSAAAYGKAKTTPKDKRGKRDKPKEGKRERYIPLPCELLADLYSFIIDSRIEPSERIFNLYNTQSLSTG